MRRMKYLFYKLIACGITVMFIVQVILNIGGVTDKTNQTASEYGSNNVQLSTGEVAYTYNGTQYSTSWFHAVNYKNYTTSVMNDTTYTVDVSKLAEGTNIGYFGTMKITDVTPTSIIATVGANANVDITNLKFQFVYFDYEGNNYYFAEDQDVAHNLPVNMHEVMFDAEKAGHPTKVTRTKEVFGAFVVNLPNFDRWFIQQSRNTKASTNGWADKIHDWMIEYCPAGMLEVVVDEYNKALTSGKSAADIDKAFAKVEKCQKYYNEACAEFNDAMNDIYWTADVQNSKLYQYKVQQITAGTAEANVVYPTFTYYYDYATQTYIVFNNSIVTK